MLVIVAEEGRRRNRRGERNTNEGRGGKMRKAIVLSFILLMGLPTLTHAQSAKEALMALKKLEARTQAGISYRD
jgi:hypothetical protein